MKYLIFLLLFSCATTPPASKNSKLVCSDLNQSANFKYPEHYSMDFQKALPQEQLSEIFSQVKEKYGECVEIVDFKASLNGDKFSTKHSDGQLIDFTIVEKNSKITGLWIHGERAKAITYSDFNQAEDDFTTLSRPSLLLIKDDKTIISLNENKRTPLGSIFKLFVLDGLLQQVKQRKLAWNDKLKISNSLKSLPSGEMQNMNEGAEFSLYDYALKMISISDNTATDHLIDKIGRTNVERQIKKRGLKLSYGWNRPFLATKDFFQLRGKFSTQDYKKYASNTTTGRLLQLQNVSKINNEKLMDQLSDWQTPRGILDAEWFSSPKEICELLKSLDNEKDEKVNSILSNNTPFVDNNFFDQIYYKGGSEPGVLQMAYYFKKEDSSYCLYLGSHDLQSTVDESVFFQKTKAMIKLIQADVLVNKI